MTSNSSLSNMRRLVEQLKLEASVERIKVRKNDTERKIYLNNDVIYDQ